MKNICIFFPDKRIGGGPYWLTALARELAKDNNYKIYYIDYKQGFARTLIKPEDNVTFIDYDAKQRYCLFEEECTLFMPIYDLHRLPIINTKSKILFFNWHNFCLPALKNSSKFLRYDMNYFLTEVFSHNAQVFLDGAHRNKCNDISGINFKPDYIPLIMNMKNVEPVKGLINDNEINIAILGRIVQDKIHSINNVINQAIKYKTDKKIIIHIIGDGDRKKDVKTSVPGNIEIRFCGVIKDKELDEYLLKNIDILFAMGNSVLNGASVGIPSYIIPSAEYEFNCDKFVFLPETTDYIAGFYYNQIKELNLKVIDFETAINNVYANNNKYELGKKCYDYINQNFNAAKVCEKFKEALDNTTLDYTTIGLIKSVQDVKKITKRKLPFKYKMLDKIWRYHKKRIGNFKNIESERPLLYSILNKIENYLLEKNVIMEDLVDGFKDTK